MVFNQLQEFLGLLQSISSVRSCRHVGESMLFCNQCTCHVLNLQSPTDMPELYAAKVVWNCEVVMLSVDNSFRGSKVNIRWQSSQRHPGCFIYPVQDIMFCLLIQNRHGSRQISAKVYQRLWKSPIALTSQGYFSITVFF